MSSVMQKHKNMLVVILTWHDLVRQLLENRKTLINCTVDFNQKTKINHQ